MTAILSSQTIVYPEIEYSDAETAFLQPLVFTICFPGPVPRNIFQNSLQFPIEISVSLSEEYQGVTPPEVRAGAWILNENSERPASIASFSQSSKTNDDIPIPFLPLPSFWDPMDSDHWLKLLKEIEQWLVADVQATTVPQWTWGRDAFWLSFIGAYPSFPSDKWEPWNPSIPLEGQFIEEWLTNNGTDGAARGALSVVDTLSLIWDEFCRHVALFYPFPLVASS